MKSRISVVTGTPAALAARRNGLDGGMAGDATTRSADVKSASRCPPSRYSIGSPSSCGSESAELLRRRPVGHQHGSPLGDEPPRRGDVPAKVPQPGDDDALVCEPLASDRSC